MKRSEEAQEVFELISEAYDKCEAQVKNSFIQMGSEQQDSEEFYTLFKVKTLLSQAVDEMLK